MSTDVDPESAPLLEQRDSFYAFRRFSGLSPQRDARRATRTALSSNKGHGLVSLLVGLDGLCILAGYILNLATCQKRCNGVDSTATTQAASALETVSFTFSCVFLLELCLSIWAFGKDYFKSRIRLFDATIIVANLALDTVLRGVAKDAASFAVVLRLWRIYQMGKGGSNGLMERLEMLAGRLEYLEKENQRLRDLFSSS